MMDLIFFWLRKTPGPVTSSVSSSTLSYSDISLKASSVNSLATMSAVTVEGSSVSEILTAVSLGLMNRSRNLDSCRGEYETPGWCSTTIRGTLFLHVVKKKKKRRRK